MFTLLLTLWLHYPQITKQETPVDARLIRVNKIWDNAPHSAFTDLVYWKNQFVCAFRTGQGHVSADGALQILSSEDGSLWKPLSSITSDLADLRDPKLCLGNQNELLLYSAAALHDKSKHTHQTYVWSSPDGKNWSPPQPLGDPNTWIWRVTRTPQNTFLGWGYDCSQERFVQLFTSTNGTQFLHHTGKLLLGQGYPNETATVIEGDHAWCLLRRDGQPPLDKAMLGISKAPYQEWNWKELDQKIGGPALLRLPNGTFLAVVRLYTPRVRTVLCRVDTATPQLHELLTLPSGGDCSYAGLVWHQSRLYISYYSSHEGKSSIYFAEVEIKQE